MWAERQDPQGWGWVPTAAGVSCGWQAVVAWAEDGLMKQVGGGLVVGFLG